MGRVSSVRNFCWPVDIVLQRQEMSYHRRHTAQFMWRATAREGSCYCSLCSQCFLVPERRTPISVTWLSVCTHFRHAQLVLWALWYVLKLKSTLSKVVLSRERLITGRMATSETPCAVSIQESAVGCLSVGVRWAVCTSTEPMAVLLLSLSSSIKHASVSVSIKELTLLEVLLDIINVWLYQSVRWDFVSGWVLCSPFQWKVKLHWGLPKLICEIPRSQGGFHKANNSILARSQQLADERLWRGSFLVPHWCNCWSVTLVRLSVKWNVSHFQHWQKVNIPSYSWEMV